jgi:hypothetical protein
MNRFFLSFGFVIVLLALMPWPALATDANGNHNTYQVLVGTGGTTTHPMGPDVATAPNGSTLSLVGSGTFNAGPNKTASGGGTFTIKDAAGHTVASGTFTITGVLEFVDYGNGTPEGFPASTHGGQGKFQVTLAGVGSGVLTVFCLLGSPPPSKEEGINLILGNGMNFTEPTSGETVYVRL